MPLCMTLNCALTISNYVSSMFEVGQAGMTSTFRSQLIYICVRLGISIPIHVSIDG